MAWETRRGRLYYYRKVRKGGRVVSEYIGSGVDAQAAAGSVRRPAPVDTSLAELDQAIKANGREISTLLAAAYVACGYHQHRGQWRKKRV